MTWAHSEDVVRQALESSQTVSAAANKLGRSLSWLQKRVEASPPLAAMYRSIVAGNIHSTRNSKRAQFTDAQILEVIDGAERQEDAAASLGIVSSVLREWVRSSPELSAALARLGERGKAYRARKPSAPKPAKPVSVLLPAPAPVSLPVLDPVRNRERYVRKKLAVREFHNSELAPFPRYTCAECPYAPQCEHAFTSAALDGACPGVPRG